MLSSRAIHTISQRCEERAIIVLVSRVIRKRVKNGYNIIKEGKELNLSELRLEVLVCPAFFSLSRIVSLLVTHVGCLEGGLLGIVGT